MIDKITKPTAITFEIFPALDLISVCAKTDAEFVSNPHRRIMANCLLRLIFYFFCFFKRYN